MRFHCGFDLSNSRFTLRLSFTPIYLSINQSIKKSPISQSTPNPTHPIDRTTMEDKTLTIVFGSLGATLALVSTLFAYLQFRGSRSAAATLDDEEAVRTNGMVQGEPIVDENTVDLP